MDTFWQLAISATVLYTSLGLAAFKVKSAFLLSCLAGPILHFSSNIPPLIPSQMKEG